MDKDWNGNNKSAFVQMGARTYATEEREQHDYYATDPSAIDDLIYLVEYLFKGGLL